MIDFHGQQKDGCGSVHTFVVVAHIHSNCDWTTNHFSFLHSLHCAKRNKSMCRMHWLCIYIFISCYVLILSLITSFFPFSYCIFLVSIFFCLSFTHLRFTCFVYFHVWFFCCCCLLLDTPFTNVYTHLDEVLKRVYSNIVMRKIVIQCNHRRRRSHVMCTIQIRINTIQISMVPILNHCRHQLQM